jgi:hypothetical protein
MLEEPKRDCKFFKPHFIYRENAQTFSELISGHCLRSQKIKGCSKCKFYSYDENKFKFVEDSMTNKMNLIIRLSNQIKNLLEEKK